MSFKFTKKALALCGAAVALASFSSVANAHLVTFGWKDNGNGTVTLYGEHWHGDQIGPSTANGGITVSDPNNAANNVLAQWIGHVNDVTIPGMNLTGFAADPGHGQTSGAEQDWFFTAPIVLGNGTWNFFTGTNCCIDTMSSAIAFQVTGITSVDPGTIGQVGAVPEPGTWAMMLLGFGATGAAMRRRRRNKGFAALPQLA